MCMVMRTGLVPSSKLLDQGRGSAAPGPHSHQRDHHHHGLFQNLQEMVSFSVT